MFHISKFLLLVLVPPLMKDSAVSGSSQTHRLYPARLLCPWGPPGKNTGVGCHALLQVVFPTQISNPWLLHLLHWQEETLPLNCPNCCPKPAGQLRRSLSRLVFVLLLPFMSLYIFQLLRNITCLYVFCFHQPGPLVTSLFPVLKIFSLSTEVHFAIHVTHISGAFPLWTLSLWK